MKEIPRATCRNRREVTMNGKKRLMRAWAAVLLTIAMATFLGGSASADDRQEAMQLVEKAGLTLESFMADNKMEAFRDLMKGAAGVFIAPQVLKGAFVFGVSGGSGILVVKDRMTRNWFGPAFYTLGGASFGLQIGGEASEVILLLMTDRGVSSLLSTSFKLGADAGLAAGPVGMGVSAATANISADILSFSRSKGLYGGISLDGAVVATRGDWNDAYYDKHVTTSEILIRHGVTNPQADKLIEAVSKGAARR